MLTVLKGPCSVYTGYGKLFLDLASRLRERMPVEILAMDNEVPAGYPLPITQVSRGIQFGLFVGPANRIGQLTTHYRVLYTMCEVSNLPRSWQLDLHIANEVWVPTTFCRDVFLEYCRPRVVRVGYNENLYCRRDWTEEDRASFWRLCCPEALGKRVIGTAGVLSPRKGIDILLRTWERLAPTNAVLVCKARDSGYTGVIRNDLKTPPAGVYVLDENWPEERMAGFYRSLDLLVLPTRAEGLCLPPLECAACGTPALVTRACGPADYIDDRGIYGLEVRGMSPVRNMTAHDAYWYEPDAFDLADKLTAWIEQPPQVEHRYRQWSMGELIGTFETELEAAQKRAMEARRR